MNTQEPNPSPRAAATLWGTVMAIGHTGDLARDVHAAVEAAEGEMTVEEVSERLDEAIEGAGLRQEAGYASGPLVVILHSHSEELATGRRLFRWLVLSRTSAGDAVYWNVAVHGHNEGISFANLRAANMLMDTIRYAAEDAA